MKRGLLWLSLLVARLLLALRYKTTYRGLDGVKEHIKKRGKGVLFLPNHPTIVVDPLMVVLPLLSLFKVRPIVVEHFYYVPFFQWWLRLINALPIPNFTVGVNSIKKRRAQKTLDEMAQGLIEQECFLIYPAGGTKKSGKEVLGGSSGVAQLLQANPEADVVLVRITGLWGSCFSRASSAGHPVDAKKAWLIALKAILKNVLFFIPKREVLIEYEMAPASFPRHASKTEINRFLEEWYNAPFPGGIEPLKRVSYSLWKEDLLEIPEPIAVQSEKEMASAPEEVLRKVVKKVAELAKVEPHHVRSNQHLSNDLGLDSLDVAELISFLDVEYDISSLNPEDLTTVGRVALFASKQITVVHDVVESMPESKKWLDVDSPRVRVLIPEGKTIPEVFFRTCDANPRKIACADIRQGFLTFRQMKMRVILLAERIQKLEGQYIGVLLPSSVAVQIVVLACHLAGKTPVMINWTIGGKHLDTVVDMSGIQHVLTSWAFLENLETVDLTRIDDMLFMLEELRMDISVLDKLKAVVLSYIPGSFLMQQSRYASCFPRGKDQEAVVLFTSGTENMPKGVPLSHNNILSNQRAALKDIALYNNDKLLAMLPSFHSFGFSITGLMPLLAGLKVVYYPNPTESKRLAHAIEHWQVNVLCSAPTFLKNILQFAKRESMGTVRLVVSGAEKAPEELFSLMQEVAPQAVFVEGYGITECAPVLTVNALGGKLQGVGKPLEGISLLIVDPQDYKPRSTGEVGLILANGPNIFAGYMGLASKSPFKEVMNRKWYVTGDLGSIGPDGGLILSGRLKRFVKIGGEMISLAAIEDALSSAFFSPTKKGEEGPLLAINPFELGGGKPKLVLFTRLPLTVSQANQCLREAGFSNLVKLDVVHQMEMIPVTATGKIAYRELDRQMPSIFTA